MAAAIKINGILAPVTNLPPGSVITLSNADNTGVTSWAWSIKDKPTGSAATLTTPSLSTTQITLDKKGTYLFQLVLNGNIATPLTGIGAVPSGVLAVRYPAAGELREADPSRGWAADLDAALSTFDSNTTPIFNVKGDTFGAKGDGTTDDTAAIQAALDAAGAIGNGAVVLLPPGTYIVSSPGTKTTGGGSVFNYCLQVWPNTTLTCRSGATIKLANSQQAVILTNKNPGVSTDSGIVLRELNLDGNYTNQNHAINTTEQGCIFMWGIHDSKFLDIRVSNAHQYFGRWLSSSNLKFDGLWGNHSYGSGWSWGVGTQEVTDMEIGDAVSLTCQGLLTPDGINGAIGNPHILTVKRCQIGRLYSNVSGEGIKFQDTTQDVTCGEVIGIGSSKHGLKFQSGSGTPTRVHVGHANIQTATGAGLYFQGCLDCGVDDYSGLGNGVSGGGGYPDVWLAGTNTHVGHIRSDSSVNAAIEIRSDAVNYQLGDVYVHNPNGDVLNLNDSTDGSIGYVEALDDRGIGAEMSAVFRVNTATSRCKCLGWRASGYTAGPIVLNAPFTTGYLQFAPIGSNFNVKDFGAKGDGTTDDTAAIQNAITTAGVSGGVVFFPPGTYKVTTGLTTTSLNNITLRGSGKSSTLNFNIGTNAGISGDSCTNLVIEDLQITGTMGQGILYSNSSLLKIRNCTISGATTVPAVETAGILLSICSDCWVLNNTLSGNGHNYLDGSGWGYDIAVSGSTAGPNRRLVISGNNCTSTVTNANIGCFNTSYSHIEGNTVSGAKVTHGGITSGGYGIMFYKTISGTEGGHNTCIGNHVNNTGGTGIYVQSNPNCVVDGNYVENTCQVEDDTSLLVAGIASNTGPTSIAGNSIKTSGKAGISVEGDFHTVISNVITGCVVSGINIRSATKSSFIGNTISNTTAGHGITTADYINSTDSLTNLNVLVQGNTVQGSSGDGIALRGMRNSQIDNNTCTGNGAHGIELQGCDHLKISQNVCQDNSTSLNNTYAGIQIDATTANPAIYLDVESNRCVNTGGTGQAYGIVEKQTVGTTDFNRFLDNNCTGNLSGQITSLGGAGQNSWRSNNRTSAGNTLPWFNVRDFGATGDGTTDDYAAVQGAINACANALAILPKGGTVYVPAGQYLVSAQLVVPDHVRLLGAGRNNSRIVKGFNGDLMQLGNDSGLEHLLLEGQGATFTGKGVFMTGSDGQQTVSHCQIINFADNCIYFRFGAGSQSSWSNISASQYNAVSGSGRYAIAIDHGATGTATGTPTTTSITANIGDVTHSSGWYDNTNIVMTSGSFTALADIRIISASVNNGGGSWTFTLSVALPGAPSAGDTLEIFINSGVPRKFTHIECNGSPTFDLGASNDTYITASTVGDILFDSQTRGCHFTSCRLFGGSPQHLKGFNNTIVACDVGPQLVLDQGGSWTIGPNTYNNSPVINNVVGDPTNLIFDYTQDVHNVRMYGAKGDGQTVTDGAIGLGSATLVCGTSTPFSSADVGKTIVVYGAGAAGVPLITTISTFTSSSQVVLGTTASTAVTGAKVLWGTDDTAALQLAFNGLLLATSGLSSGGTIFLPPGVYITNTYINLQQPGAHVLGYGAKIVQIGSAQLGILVNGVDEVTIEGLWLYNGLKNGGWTGGAVNVLGIRLYNASDCKISNCRVENWGEGQISLLGTSNHNTVQNCRLIGVGSAGGLVGGSDFNFGIYGETNGLASCQFLNNEISDAVHGIFLANDWTDTLIQGNNIHDMIGQHGVYVDGGKNLRILSNVVHSVAGSGIKVQITSGTTADCTNLVIEGNTVDGPGGTGILVIPATTGLTYRFKSPVISGNAVHNCGQDGILFDQADNFLVSNNTVNTATEYGIRTQTGAPAGHTCGSGRIHNNTIAGIQQDGIHGQLTDSSHTVEITDNLLVDVGLGGAGFSAITILDGIWLIKRCSVINSGTPTFDYSINASAAARYQIHDINLPALNKTLNLLGTFVDSAGGINVRDFGAVGDGSTNDSSAFNAAIATLSGGGTLLVPPGIYRANILMNVSNITVRGTSQQLFEDGQVVGSKIVPHTFTSPAIQIGDGTASVTGAVLENLYLVGDSTTATSDGLYIYGASNVRINGLNVTNFGRDNIRITSSATQGTNFVFINGLVSVNYIATGLNVIYGASVTEYIFISNFEFNDGANRGPTCHSIQINDGVFLELAQGFISCSGAAPGDQLGQSGSIHISGEPSTPTHLFMNNVSVDSPAAGSIDELIVIEHTNVGGPGFISGHYTVDGVLKYNTDSTIVDLRNSYGGIPEQFMGPNREFSSGAAPASGVTVYNVGDRIWNQSPVAGGSMGWVCTTAGAFANSGAWAPLTAYHRGDGTHTPQSVTNDGGKVYWCIQDGTSAGSGGPTGTSFDITDGTCHWRYVAAGAPVFKEFGLISV